MGSSSHEKHRENCEETKLSYMPSSAELPFYESLFRFADTTKNGIAISSKEAMQVLSLSCLSRQKLNMILKIATSGNSSILNRDQFYVAVRLIQFRQNEQSVKNLTLTVPDGVNLKPPHFEGFNSLEITGFHKSQSKGPLDGNKCGFSDVAQDSTIMPLTLRKRCFALEKEVKDLKQKLQTATEELQAVKADNDMLRKRSSPVIQSQSHCLENNDNHTPQTKHTVSDEGNQDFRALDPITTFQMAVNMPIQDNCQSTCESSESTNQAGLYIVLDRQEFTHSNNTRSFQRLESFMSDITDDMSATFKNCSKNVSQLNQSEKSKKMTFKRIPYE